MTGPIRGVVASEDSSPTFGWRPGNLGGVLTAKDREARPAAVWVAATGISLREGIMGLFGNRENRETIRETWQEWSERAGAQDKQNHRNAHTGQHVAAYRHVIGHQPVVDPNPGRSRARREA